MSDFSEPGNFTKPDIFPWKILEMMKVSVQNDEICTENGTGDWVLPGFHKLGGLELFAAANDKYFGWGEILLFWR